MCARHLSATEFSQALSVDEGEVITGTDPTDRYGERQIPIGQAYEVRDSSDDPDALPFAEVRFTQQSSVPGDTYIDRQPVLDFAVIRRTGSGRNVSYVETVSGQARLEDMGNMALMIALAQFDPVYPIEEQQLAALRAFE